VDTFCKLISEGRILAGTGPFLFHFDIHPVSAGHLLVIPRRHVQSLAELNAMERDRFCDAITSGQMHIVLADLVAVYQRMIEESITANSVILARKALKQLERDSNIIGMNVGWNSGTAAGQTVNHLHIHIMPRYKGDVDTVAGGVRQVIPKHADYQSPIA
jgi:diadenosine tetraphosphate (Ap4A) HIT family hydrolase